MTTGTLTFTQGNGNCTDFTALAGLTVPQVASNQLSAVTGGTTYAGLSVVTLGPDMRIGVTAVGAIPASSSSLAIIARCDSSANGYSFEIQSGTWFINRLDAGVPTQLATGSRTSVASDLYEIEIIGTALKCYANGTQIGTTQTASSYTTNTKFGIVLLRNTGTLTADNMAYTDAFAPDPPTSVVATAKTEAADLSWTAPAAGAAPTDYLIQQRIGPYPATTSQASAPSQLTTVDNTAGTAYVYRWTGTGVTIFVPGAGVRGTHTEFTGRLGSGFDAGGGTPFTDGVSGIGHDTGTASVALGTTYGIAKGATVYPVRCMATDPGAGIPVSVANMRTGLAHILSVAVVGHSVVFWSMLGYTAGDTDSDGHTVTSGDVTNITADVQAIIDRGIPVVVAAGNNGGTYNVTPQNMTDVINVGNCNATTLDKSTTSSFGALIDIWAVASGTGTVEASNASDSASYNGSGAGYDGTSEAAPIVAGTIACMLEAASYNLTPAQIWTLLSAQATATGSVGAGSPTKLVNARTDPQSWTTYTDAVSTATTATVTGLAGVAQYTFRVASFNASGTSAYVESNTVTTLGSQSSPRFPIGRVGDPRWQWVQRFGIDTGVSADLRQGAATAYLAVCVTSAGAKIAQAGTKTAIAVGARQAGTKQASGAAVAAVAVSVKESGSKLTGGSATAHVAVWVKQAGSKLIDAAAKAAITVWVKQSGTKVAQGATKAPPAVSAPAAGTKIGQGTAKDAVTVNAKEAGSKIASGSGKASLAVFAREAASKLTNGMAVAAVAVWAPVAGTKVGSAIEASARAVISVFAKAAGSKIAGGSGKAPITVEDRQAGNKLGAGGGKVPITVSTKQSAVKIAQGTAKVPVSVFARQLGAKLAQAVARAALAVWARAAGIVIDLTLGAGTGETFLAGPDTSTRLLGPDTTTMLAGPDTDSSLAGPTTSTTLVPVETETTL